MDYYFSDFHFNSLSLLLSKNGQPLAIRNNEAKLLAFFLAAPEQVFSKDAILENVWAGKVVSEQAVFQAISNLRNVFGEDALKTFPKKGYQWQLALTQAPAHANPQRDDQITAIANAGIVANKNPRSYKGLLWSCAALVMVGLTLLFKHIAVAPKSVASAPAHIVVQPFMLDAHHSGALDIAQQVQTAVIAQLTTTPSLVAHLPPSTHSPHQVAAEPAHFLNLYNQTITANLLLSGRVRQVDGQLVLSFVLQGRQRQWQGYLMAQTPTELANKVADLLSKTAPLTVLWESNDLRLIDAQLQLLCSEHPDDLPMLYRLIDNALYLGDVDTARLRAVELEQKANSARNIPYQALALRAQAFASLDQIDAGQYLALLDKSVALAAEFNDPLLHSRVLEHYTYIYYRQKNFDAIEQKLLAALTLAETATAPEQQAQILRLLSIFSYKLHRADKRDLYLSRAQAILDEHQFPSESYALLEDIAGMFTDDKTQKEHFFWQALKRFTPEQDAWVKERAQEHLVNLYIDQQRWPDAFAVFATETTLSGAELFYIAKIHFNQKNYALAQTQAEAAFKQGNMSGEYAATLEAALLLAQLHQQFEQPYRQKTYVEYINKNALPAWKKSKQLALSELVIDEITY
jgi:DNA-binding winged helix-turn-helix (wHTH) protein